MKKMGDAGEVWESRGEEWKPCDIQRRDNSTGRETKYPSTCHPGPAANRGVVEEENTVSAWILVEEENVVSVWILAIKAMQAFYSSFGLVAY